MITICRYFLLFNNILIIIFLVLCIDFLFPNFNYVLHCFSIFNISVSKMCVLFVLKSSIASYEFWMCFLYDIRGILLFPQHLKLRKTFSISNFGITRFKSIHRLFNSHYIWIDSKSCLLLLKFCSVRFKCHNWTELSSKSKNILF